MRDGLASKAFAERQSPHSRIDIYTANRFVEPLDPTPGHWRCGALISSHEAWLTMSRFTQGNLTSRLKLLDGKSQPWLDTVRYFDNWRHSEQNNARAPA